MAFDARVLILAADDGRIGPLAAGLDALGWRTVTARDVVSGEMTLKDFPLEAAVVDIEGPVSYTHLTLPTILLV